MPLQKHRDWSSAETVFGDGGHRVRGGKQSWTALLNEESDEGPIKTRKPARISPQSADPYRSEPAAGSKTKPCRRRAPSRYANVMAAKPSPAAVNRPSTTTLGRLARQRVELLKEQKEAVSREQQLKSGFIAAADRLSTKAGLMMRERREILKKEEQLRQELLEKEEQLKANRPQAKITPVITTGLMGATVGSLLSARGELQKQRKELEEREQQLRRNAESRRKYWGIARGPEDVLLTWLGPFPPIEAVPRRKVFQETSFHREFLDCLELTAVAETLSHVGRLEQLATYLLGRLLQEHRARPPAITIVGQQERFLTLHSFHPPHSHSSVRSSFGRIGMAA